MNFGSFFYPSNSFEYQYSNDYKDNQEDRRNHCERQENNVNQ